MKVKLPPEPMQVGSERVYRHPHTFRLGKWERIGEATSNSIESGILTPKHHAVYAYC